ncbi:MAG: hypothetical protein QXE63_06465 [Zestosphaera sp.]
MVRRVKLFGDKRIREDGLTEDETREVEEGRLKVVDVQFESEKWVTWASMLNKVANRLGRKIPVEDWSDEEIEAFIDDFDTKPLAFRIRNGVWDPDTIEGHIQKAHSRLADDEIERIHKAYYETGRCPVDGWRRREEAAFTY